MKTECKIYYLQTNHNAYSANSCLWLSCITGLNLVMLIMHTNLSFYTLKLKSRYINNISNIELLNQNKLLCQWHVSKRPFIFKV